MYRVPTVFLMLLGFLLVPNLGMGQEKNQEKNLDLLFREWAVSYQESSDEVIILRLLEDEKLLKTEDKSTALHFKIGMDSIVYHNELKNGSIGCGTGFSPKVLAEEIWSLDYENLKLRNDFYFVSSQPTEAPDYSAIYKIVSLNENYLKLSLEKELFESQ